MASNDLIEAPLQDFDTKRTFDTERPGNIINRAAWFQLIQEPQPLLRKRQSKIFIPRYTWQTRPYGCNARRSTFQMPEDFSLSCRQFGSKVRRQGSFRPSQNELTIIPGQSNVQF